MRRRAFLRAGGLAGVAAVAGCLDSRASAGGDFDVGMSSVAFKPREVTVAAGDALVWRNTSKQGHTVTAYADRIPAEADFFASGGFDSESAARDAWIEGFGGLIESGRTYRHTFGTPGEYTYFCIPHERAGMVGTVAVE